MLLKNLAFGIVAAPPSPTDSGTSLGLDTGHVARFPNADLEGVYHCTVCPADADPTPDNAEIIKVTADDTGTDIMTIVREQRGSSAREIEIGDRVFLGIYKEDFDEITTDISDLETSVAEDLVALDEKDRRQLLINGNFQIWQRATTSTNPSTGALIADRWKIVFAVASPPTNIVHSRQAITPGDIYGSFYHYRIAPDGAGTVGAAEYYQIEQRIEHGVRLACGASKKITISFKAKSSIAGKKIGVWGQQNYGTGGAPSTADTLNGEYITLTSSWADYEVTLDAATLVGKTFGTDNNDYLRIVLMVAWGSDYTSIVGSTSDFGGSGNIDIAQVQVNIGDTAVPFFPRTYEEELRLCQRYCFAMTESETNANIGVGFAASTTVAHVPVIFPETMRTLPTLVKTATDWQLADQANPAVDVTALAISANQNGRNQSVLQATVASGLTQYRPYLLYADVTANRLLYFDAEL